MLHRHKTDERFAAAKADVDSLLQRLGRDVSTLDDGGDPVNRQGLADAGERYETAQVQFGKSESVPELLVARSIAVEGLQSTRATGRRLPSGPWCWPWPWSPSASGICDRGSGRLRRRARRWVPEEEPGSAAPGSEHRTRGLPGTIGAPDQ